MNISKQNIDDLTATITLTVEKEDYEGNVEKILKDYRKKAQIPGFRVGKAPMGMIKKQYGMSVQWDEINKLVSSELQKYLSEADFKILGEPLPSEKQEKIDFESQDKFDFLFDIGLSPDVDIELTDKDSIVKYDIKVADNAVDDRIKNFTTQFAQMTNPEVSEERDMVKGDVAQIEADGNIVEGGMAKDGAVLMPERIEDANVKKSFVGVKVGSNVVFNPLKAMGNETEVASFLGIEKENIVDADVKFTVTELTRYVDAELNEELFEKVYPNAEIKTEEDFRKKVEEDVKKGLENDAEARFEWEARDYVIEKLKDVAFPEAFLKRWITVSNEGKEDFNPEEMEKEFPKILDDLRWQLATGVIAKKAELKVEAGDPLETAKKMAAQQFAMYGMANLPEQYYEDYAKKMLEDQAQMEQIINRTMNEKVVEHIKSVVKLKSKKISVEDFGKLYEQA